MTTFGPKWCFRSIHHQKTGTITGGSSLSLQKLPKTAPGGSKTDFGRFLIDFLSIFDRFLIDFWSIVDWFMNDEWRMMNAEWSMMNAEWWMLNDEWWMMMDDEWWMMNEEWRMMNDERWMIEYPMNYEWWMMNEEWSLMNPQWWPPKHIIHFESIRKVRRYSSCMIYDHVTFAEAIYKLLSNMDQ